MSTLYPLEAPNGWFLENMRHEHTRVVYPTDNHEPVQAPQGPWVVAFQKYPKGGNYTTARGHTMEEAWKNACEAVARRERGEED